MTYADVYIGQLGKGRDPLNWGGDWNGNTPAPVGSFFSGEQWAGIPDADEQDQKR